MRRLAPWRPRHAVGTLALTVILASCATMPASSPPATGPISGERALELARRWAAEWEAFPGVRAATELTIRTPRSTDRVAALLLISQTALRVEVATPFGFPALVGVAGPDGITIFRALERRAPTASPSPEAAARWLGIPLAPATLIPLLVGHVPLPPDPATITVETTPTPHLVWTRDGMRHRVWPSPHGRVARLVIESEGRVRLIGNFERGLGGDLGTVRLDAPERETQLLLRYVSAEYVTLPPTAFQLTLPPDVPVQRLD